MVKMFEENIKTDLTKHDLVCDICQMEFKCKWDLQNHIRNRHLNLKKDFKCDICLKEMTSKQGLKHHIQENHSANIVVSTCYLEMSYGVGK